MAQQLTKEQREALYINTQIKTEEELISALKKENLFNTDAFKNQLGEQGFTLSREEAKSVGKHIEDRKKLQDTKKRVQDTAAENISKTESRIQALGHLQVGKEQVKNYLDKVAEGAAFDEMVRNTFRQKSPVLDSLMNMQEQIDQQLDELYQNPSLTEKTRIHIYNSLQQTKMYITAHIKETARGMYIQTVLAPKLRESGQNEEILTELLGMEEISQFQEELSPGLEEVTQLEDGTLSIEEAKTPLGIMKADIAKLKTKFETSVKTEENTEEVKEIREESQKEGKKHFTYKEAIAYQTEKVNEEIEGYKHDIEHLSELKSEAKRLDKIRDRNLTRYAVIRKDTEYAARNYYGSLIQKVLEKQNKSKAEISNIVSDAVSFMVEQIKDYDVIYAKACIDNYLKEHPELNEIRDADFANETRTYNTLMSNFVEAFRTKENAQRDCRKLQARIKGVEEYGKQLMLHPAMKEYEIRSRAERMLVRQHRPDTLRQLEDKIDSFKKGKRYIHREGITENYQKSMAETMLKIQKTEANPPTMAEIENQVSEFLEMVINKSKFCMCVPRKVDSILTNTAEGIQSDGKFKNSLENSFRGEGYNNTRFDFTEAKYGKEFVSDLSDYEKYGYIDDQSGIFHNNSPAGAFGEIKYIFKKDKLKNRTTFTFGDSMGLSEYSQPSMTTKPSLISIPEPYRDSVIKYAREYHRYMNATEAERKKMYDFSNLTIDKLMKEAKGDYGKGVTGFAKYMELQYHGKLTTDDVEEVVYYVGYKKVNNEEHDNDRRNMDTDVAEFLKEKRGAIEQWRKKGVTVKLMMPYMAREKNRKQPSLFRGEFDITKADINELLKASAEHESINGRNSSVARLLKGNRINTEKVGG